jgi:hypothetical protein
VAITALFAVGTTADEWKRAAARLRIEVDDARRAGASWDSIGAMLGCTGENARKKFSPRPITRQTDTSSQLELVS